MTEATLKNTLVAENTAASGNDVSGTFSSNGFNLIANNDESAFTDVASDIIDVAPMVGDLQANGGPTQTIELLDGSEGINNGDGADTFNDQRDAALVGTRDIGAFEFGSLGVNNTGAVQVSTIYPNPSSGNLNITINDTVANNVELSIFSTTGNRVCHSQLQTGENSLNFSQLALGMYLLNINTTNGVQSHKLII